MTQADGGVGPRPGDGCPFTFQQAVHEREHTHALYDALRAHDPVTWDAAGRCWLVTGHDAVRKILADERFVSDPAAGMTQARRPARRSFVTDAIQRQVVFSDGPRQQRVQKAVLRDISRRGDPLSAPMRAAASKLAERAKARGEIDLVADFAVPYSMQAISMVLGLPPLNGEELERLERWSTTYADLTSGHLRMEMDDVVALGDYFRERVAIRRAEPADDLVQTFLSECGLENDEEVVIQCMMAFAAGRVTTQKLLGDGIPRLIPEWAEWRAKLGANPGAARRLTEELLRLVTPTRYVARFAAHDVALAGGPVMRRGEKAILFLEAANRDPAPFPCPHALEAERQPNPHVTFGHGPHRCPGAAIARTEIHLALQVLLETLEALHPHPTKPPEWSPNPNLGGYRSYPCVCG